MNKEFLFSIIIPTYNRENLLIRALNSLISQSYKNFEVIVVDDGSTDETELACNFYKELFEGFTYFKINNSGGPAKPRNIGIEASKGKWICFLDSDDYWYPQKLEFCYKNISENVDVLYHDLSLMGIRGKIAGLDLGTNPFKTLITKGNRIPLSSSVVRSNIIKNIKFDESKVLSSLEDYKFWLMISKKTTNFKYLNICLGYYNIDHNIRITQFNENSAYKYLFLKNNLINENFIIKENSFFFNYCIAINLFRSNKKSRSTFFFRNVLYNHPVFSFKFKSFVFLIFLKIMK